MKRVPWIMIWIVLALAACTFRRGEEPVPTEVAIDNLATQTVLTENAPPAGWRDPVSFPEIDAGLRELSGWRYEVKMSFEGTFARTPRQTTASTSAEVWFDQLGTARRVVVETSNELGGQLEANTYEAVRLGPDVFLVRDNACLSNATEAAETAADLSAGQLVGGVQRAVPLPQPAVINGQQVWRYDFTIDDLVLPQIQSTDESHITLVSSELWIAPEHSAVIRFWALLDVENVLIFDSALPVTGQIIMRYDLYDIGVVPNISIPFGC